MAAVATAPRPDQAEASLPTIEDDIASGETPIPLSRLTRESFVPKQPDGSPRHVSVAFRWRQRGLETLRTPAGFVTTRSAWFRFCAKLTGGGPLAAAAMTPALVKRQHRAAEAKLDEDGF